MPSVRRPISEGFDPDLPLSGDEIVPALQDGQPVKITVQDIADLGGGGGGGGGGANLSLTRNATGATVFSDSGTDAAIPLADATDAGLMSPTQFSKLETAVVNASATVTANRLARFNGTDARALQDSTYGVTDVIARGNHTGSQLAATISDFNESVDDRVAALLTAGSGIGLSYNDGAGTLTVSASNVPIVVGTIAALRALTSATVATAVIVLGYNSAISRHGGGIFIYDTSDAASADNSGTIIVDLAGRRWKRDLDDEVTYYDFGAAGDGSTNDATPIANCFAWAVANTKVVRIPAGNFASTSTITLQKPLKLVGDGMNASRHIYSGAFTGFFINPQSGVAADNNYYYLADFSIEPSVAGGGTYGLLCTVASSEYLGYSVFERLLIGQFGTRGFYLNNTGVTGGFFNSTFRDMYIYNGFLGNQIGDRLLFQGCTFHASGNYMAFSATQMTGARELTIRDGSLTCQGGGLNLSSCVGVNFEDSWIEHPYYYGDNLGAVASQCQFNSCTHARVRGCELQPLASMCVSTLYALYCAGTCVDIVVDDCELGIGETAHIGIINTTSNTRIGKNNRDMSGGTITFSDGSVTTRNFYAPPQFKAHKNGTNQTGIPPATLTKVTFTTEARDIGNQYDAANSRWTPKAGEVILNACVRIEAQVIDGNIYALAIYKNGGLLEYGAFQHSGSVNVLGVSVFCQDTCNGTDFYEVYVYAGGGATPANDKTIVGVTNHTHFEGSWLRA